MYVQDDLIRINIEASKDKIYTCDYCDKIAAHDIPVYNPADSLRGIDGAYTVYHLCNHHYNDDDGYLEGNFYCADCNKLFILNHSWDYLAVNIGGELYCQECAIKHIEPISLGELIQTLQENDTSNWLRINSIPDKELWLELEFSSFGDFPGCTSLEDIINLIQSTEGYDDNLIVYPVVSHTYQFSCVLALYV